MSFYQSIISERLGGNNFGKEEKIYKFEKIKRAKALAKKEHPELPLIDMGVGEPDSQADDMIIQKLCEEAGKLENRFYADNGIVEFQEMACKYMEEVYGVKGLEPDKNIIHGIGSKSILAILPLCVINPGDVVIMTTPGYPVLGTYTKYLGGEVYNLPLTEENNFYPDLSMIPQDILKRSKMLYINYPNNPTGQVATVEFFEGVVKFAKENHIMVVHDAAYAALVYDDTKPLSFLSVSGAMDIGVEVQSLSKAFNMTGWRMAFLVGDEKIVKAYGTIKDNTDSGQFRAIQKSASVALNNTSITKRVCEKYSRRLELLTKALNEVGFHAKKSPGTFYCYVKSPIGTKLGDKFETAEDAAEYLIKNAVVSTVPWDDAGAYLRLSVTFDAQNKDEEKKIINELKERLLKLELVF